MTPLREPRHDSLDLVLHGPAQGQGLLQHQAQHGRRQVGSACEGRGACEADELGGAAAPDEAAGARGAGDEPREQREGRMRQRGGHWPRGQRRPRLALRRGSRSGQACAARPATAAPTACAACRVWPVLLVPQGRLLLRGAEEGENVVEGGGGGIGTQQHPQLRHALRILCCPRRGRVRQGSGT